MMRAHKCTKYALAETALTARALCAQLVLQAPLPKSEFIISNFVSYCVQLRCIFMTPQTPYGTHNQLKAYIS